MKIASVPSFFDVIAPRNSCSSSRRNTKTTTPEEDDISVHNGTSLLCPSHTDSKIMRFRSRFRNFTKSEVGRKIWKSIARLRVVSGVDDNSRINLVDAMESRDKSGLKGKMVNSLLS